MFSISDILRLHFKHLAIFYEIIDKFYIQLYVENIYFTLECLKSKLSKFFIHEVSIRKLSIEFFIAQTVHQTMKKIF